MKHLLSIFMLLSVVFAGVPQRSEALAPIIGIVAMGFFGGAAIIGSVRGLEYAMGQGRYVSFARAACAGNSEVVARYILDGNDVNVQNEDGFSALHCAAEQDQRRIVKYLIDAGADVNIRDNEGRTPLFYAALNNNSEIFSMLKDALEQ